MSESFPIPVQLMQPWIKDNLVFLQGIEERQRQLEEASVLREQCNIRAYVPCLAAPLAAVDAAVVDVTIGDLMSILIQAVHVDDLGGTTFDIPYRLTGINGQELSLSRTPLRVAMECSMLAKSTGITIADTSFWSMLMEVNQVITRYENGGAQQQGIAQSYRTLVKGGVFLAMLRNPCVIAMSKTNQSGTLGKKHPAHNPERSYVSDRELLGRILQPGEFLAPVRLVEGSGGKFGVEKRGWRDSERQEIQDIYEHGLGLTYFKPHSWTRAFRIEGTWEHLTDDEWLMPLLSALVHHTQDRTAEPWPQFMSDWNAKKIAAIAKLYGELNFHRTPFFDPTRTSF